MTRTWTTLPLLTLVLLLVVGTVPALAIWGDNLDNNKPLYDPDHDHMVQFGLEHGLELYWGHRVSDNGFWRYGMNLYLNAGGSEAEYEHPDTAYTVDSRSNGQDVTFHADRLFMFDPMDRVRMYWGVGPYVEFGRSYSESDDPNPEYNLPTVTNWTSWMSVELGARVLVGGEFALSSRAGLFVESSLRSGWSYRKTQVEQSVPIFSDGLGQYEYARNDRVITSNRWDMSLDGVMVGVSFRY